MIVNTVSLDSSGRYSDGREVRQEVEARLGGGGDPLDILIRLEETAMRRLQVSERMVKDERKYVNAFINHHIRK